MAATDDSGAEDSDGRAASSTTAVPGSLRDPQGAPRGWVSPCRDEDQAIGLATAALLSEDGAEICVTFAKEEERQKEKKEKRDKAANKQRRTDQKV